MVLPVAVSNVLDLVANSQAVASSTQMSAGFFDTVGDVVGLLLPQSGSTILPRSASTTTSSSGSNCTGSASQCNAKPQSINTITLAVVLGVCIPVFGAAFTLLYLHRRHVRKQREEDANDRHASMDFGLGDVANPGVKRRVANGAGTDVKEKSGRHARQLSMDMDMNSPYLLPPELQDSRESLHSLSRTIHQNEDPYRPVTQYYPSDASSMRSLPKSKHDGSSIRTGSSGTPSKLQDIASANLLSNAARMSSSTPPNGFIPPPRQNSLPNSRGTSRQDNRMPSPYNAIVPGNVQQPSISVSESGAPNTPKAGPLTYTQSNPTNGLAPSPAFNDNRESYASNEDAAIRRSHNYLGAFIDASDPSPAPTQSNQRSELQELPAPVPARGPPQPAMLDSLPLNARPARKESLPVIQTSSNTFMDNEGGYNGEFEVTPPSPNQIHEQGNANVHNGAHDNSGKEYQQGGLGLPSLDPRRLSMGFRPLPPETATESDDPEIRANRIRSFYKEYFDDSKPAPQGQYFEDYDENYLGDAAYFDPQSNNFVMPYTQPVTRRAMTPPPRGPRFQGPPRTLHGSMGGSARRFMPPPPGPRAYSSASGRMGPPAARKPMAPPAPLNSLPTPSKLKDDSFALMNSIQFAPPTSYKDRQAGRSESPLGERRPYSPSVPAHVPLHSAFDELAPMPSPHLLRKSGTFTALDFAPPRRIKDSDSASDAGSIRSNRSGVSARQLGAIRNGAYRVSRIPQDMVFTRDDMAATLKPQWGMRPGS